jgi:hypothetical protein
MKIISEDGHGDELFVSRSSDNKRLVFVASYKPGRKTVIVAATPDDARKLAVQTVRIADMIDPPGSFVRRETAWKRAASFPPPTDRPFLAREAGGDPMVVVWDETRRSFLMLNGYYGDAIDVFDWTEVPR